MNYRSIAALVLLFLASVPACAQVLDAWERPRNAATLPVAAPTAVEIYLPQKNLYVMDEGALNPMMGGLAYGIASVMQDRREERLEAMVAQLVAAMPVAEFDSLLLDAFKKHVGPAQFAEIKRITVHHDTPSAVEKATPGDPEEQTLALTVRYYFSPSLSDLRVAMVARLGPRRIVTAPPAEMQPQPAARSPVFSQALIYDVPGRRGLFSKEVERSAVWADMGAEAIAAHIRAGIDGVMAMLPLELASQPIRGRRAGKQIPWGESQQSSTFGVFLRRLGDRALVRLRNGLLLSLPITDERLPAEASEVGP